MRRADGSGRQVGTVMLELDRLGREVALMLMLGLGLELDGSERMEVLAVAARGGQNDELADEQLLQVQEQVRVHVEEWAQV